MTNTLPIKSTLKISFAAILFSANTTLAQTDSSLNNLPPIDFSQFAGDADEITDGANSSKQFCTSKIFGISPSKLISIGYDHQLGHDMTANTTNASYNSGLSNERTSKVSNTQGLRLLANFPVISRNNIIVNLGATYWESNYKFKNSADRVGNHLVKALDTAALRTTGVNFTIFKPLNSKNFILFNSSHDLNGNYTLSKFQPLKYTKHSIMAVYGWKKHDRLQIGFGLSRTYRVGEMNYIPVVLYNYTASNRKWGIEAIFPARANYRRSFTPRSILLLGYEIEGNSYRLNNTNGNFNQGATQYNDIELRRSELRFRATYEFSLYQFIWLSVQAGYRYNYRFSVDDGEFFRGFFGNQKYVMENKLTNPLFFNVSLNLVSP